MRTTIKLAALTVLVGIVAAPRPAAAGKIPIVYQTGQETFESGPLPEPYDKEPALAGAHAGYICDVTGVFWSYFSIASCKPAAIRGNQYDDSAELAAAIKAKYPSPSIPFWANHGWKLMIGGVLLVVVGGFLLRRKGDDDEDTEETTDHVRTPLPQPVAEAEQQMSPAPLPHAQAHNPYAQPQQQAHNPYAPPQPQAQAHNPYAPPQPHSPYAQPQPHNPYAPTTYAAPGAYPPAAPYAQSMPAQPVHAPHGPYDEPRTQLGHAPRPPVPGQAAPNPYVQGHPQQQAYAQYAQPAPLADDGPTTADPSWQAHAEQHYAQHNQRHARGTHAGAHYEQVHVEQPTVPYGGHPQPPQHPSPQVQAARLPAQPIAVATRNRTK